MQPKSVIRTTAYTVGFLWSIATALSGAQLDHILAKILSFVPLGLVLLFTLWDVFLWRVGPFLKLSGRPDLNGVWLGEFDSTWIGDDDSRNETVGPTALSIKQTFTTLSIVLVAEKSKSYSILANIRRLESGEFRINYEYANTPKLKFRRTMPAHAGSAELTVAAARCSTISGEYWTNRFSRGTLDLQWITAGSVTSLDEARQLKPSSDAKSRSRV